MTVEMLLMTLALLIAFRALQRQGRELERAQKDAQAWRQTVLHYRTLHSEACTRDRAQRARAQELEAKCGELHATLDMFFAPSWDRMQSELAPDVPDVPLVVQLEQRTGLYLEGSTDRLLEDVQAVILRELGDLPH